MSNVTLTARECWILAAMAEGRKNQEIAVELGKSESHMNNIIAKLYSKIGAANRLEAAVWWVRLQQGARP